MRRAFSLLFVFLFGFGPLAAVIDYGDDSSLPACCRRSGAHHCVMSDAMLGRAARAALDTPALTAPRHCPQFPARGNAAPSSVLALVDPPDAKTTDIPAFFRVAPNGSHASSIHLRKPALRGPPQAALGA